MEEKLYIIEQVCCRGDIAVNKHSFNREKFFSLLDVFKEDSFDEDGELSEEVSNKIVELFGEGSCKVEQLLYNMLVGCVYFCDDLTFKERIQAIKKGKYCAELEEVNIAVGFSAKEAKANLIEFEDEDW